MESLLIIPILWIAMVAGRQINCLVYPKLASDDITPLERCCFGMGTGLILLSLGILAVGLIGRLTIAGILSWIAVVAVIGLAEHVQTAKDIFGRSSKSCSAQTFSDIGYVTLIVVIAVITIAGCFMPPNSLEWDSLSYHLADPKLYLIAHKIIYLPWESHSNFAFNMEMLYTIGMAFHSIPFAKLFSFSLGVIGVFALYSIANRLFGVTCARLTSLLYISIPLVMWEAGTAYVDLAATSYGILGMLALLHYARTKDRNYIWLTGIMLGGMFGIKATALIPISLLAFGLILYKVQIRKKLIGSILLAKAIGAIAIVIGSPWYIKAWINTGNPVYPFAYNIFGGKYQNAANMAAYSASQAEFGVGHRPADLLLAPWNLVMYLMPGHIPPSGFAKPFNDYQDVISTLTPIFLITSIIGLLLPLKPPKSIRYLAWYSLLSFIIWFYLTQQVRYLLPLVPAFCLISAWIILRLREFAPNLSKLINIITAATIAVSIGMFGWRQIQIGRVLLSPNGVDRYLSAGLTSYGAINYINHHTPPNSKILTFGEPCTLYLDGDYAWGEPGHSLIIPFEQLKSPDALHHYLVSQGYSYILINLAGAPLQEDTQWDGKVKAMTLDSETPIYADSQHGVYVFAL